MIIAIPKEIKDNEYRVALTPSSVRELVLHGHRVLVQSGAGLGSGFADIEYTQDGATIVLSADEAWNQAEMVVKVKEPQPSEYSFLRNNLIIFTYLHLAIAKELMHKMLASGVTGLAYETVQDAKGRTPLLQPMSEVAGRMAVQIITRYLQKPEGGRGILLAGIPGVKPAHVIILGAGTVGTNAAQVALGMGAQVTLLDIDMERLCYLEEVLHGRLTTLYSNANNIAEVITSADAVIGAVLIVGARAPRLVTRDLLSTMKKGSTIVDVSVDQGGCVETIQPTTHSNPTYVVDNVLHYGVTNMPGAVPRTSSLGLSNATIPYILRVASLGLREALKSDRGLEKGLNVYQGNVMHPELAKEFGLPLVAFQSYVSRVTHTNASC